MNTGQAHPRPIIFSYGLGADSTAILLRWLTDPSSRDFDLTDLTVVTAMTGDEWPVTGELVQQHIVPQLAAHGVRWIQAARSQRLVSAAGEGVIILDDSTTPTTVHIDGMYRLSARPHHPGRHRGPTVPARHRFRGQRTSPHP
jgi:hypothetical protein